MQLGEANSGPLDLHLRDWLVLKLASTVTVSSTNEEMFFDCICCSEQIAAKALMGLLLVGRVTSSTQESLVIRGASLFCNRLLERD